MPRSNNDDEKLMARLEKARRKLDAGIKIAARRRLTEQEQIDFAALEELVKGLASQIRRDRLLRGMPPKQAPVWPVTKHPRTATKFPR